ncbi:methionine biosynthesis PLP-dependent protein [Geomicrobium sp. JCM 19055]|uniref:methionine biosynthesis PLP-dependent protein n=1 Tax=Geomicrobium sp. JCM 19055 TaxID=1460649 RepID=UPI00045ED04E|nr:methionine biosynthesis PLP-dependent protein [Geomicrobium sp. JCM 19055]GAJ98719.1 cystathionine gamma-synthase [Geomicrobium sp. JCM 19055]
MEKQPFTTETKLVQTGNRSDERTGAVNAPIYMSTAYRHSGVGETTGYDYARTGNPTREILEDSIADLEGGIRGFACSSGMAAIQAVLSLFESGDEIVASLDLYGGTYRLFNEYWPKWGVGVQYGDPRDLETFEALIGPQTKALFIETPTNPQMQEADILELSDVAKRHNLLLIVDNTFYTPLIQQPLKEGAHIVIHSATKYLGGHNDLVAGLIATNDETIAEKLFNIQNGIGMTLGAFDSWLLVRGMKTLALRMKKHEENARIVSQFLAEHSLVKEVLYPGRGGMLSFRVTSSDLVDPVLRKLQLITFAESLGGVESLMTYPAVQTHADVPKEVRQQIGIDDCLMRMSCGIENAEDLIEDLRQAFQVER